jgi:hypothetical protein
MRSGRASIRALKAPLSEADGAARVLFPIFEALQTLKPLSGLFFQDFKPCAW